MKELTCIICPKGCRISIKKSDISYEVIGNGCKNGLNYAIKEMDAPERTVSSTVRIENAIYPVCPVKTSGPIPKGLIQDAVKELNNISITSPVHIGERIVEIGDTGVFWQVTKEM